MSTIEAATEFFLNLSELTDALRTTSNETLERELHRFRRQLELEIGQIPAADNVILEYLGSFPECEHFFRLWNKHAIDAEKKIVAVIIGVLAAMINRLVVWDAIPEGFLASLVKFVLEEKMMALNKYLLQQKSAVSLATMRMFIALVKTGSEAARAVKDNFDFASSVSLM